jgi:hypothetical protein
MTASAGYNGCESKTSYASCQHTWETTAPDLYPRHVGIWSFASSRAAKAWLKHEKATASSLSWSVGSSGPESLVLFVDADGAGYYDVASVYQLHGANVVNAQCMRQATSGDFGAVTSCADRLATAQAKRLPQRSALAADRGANSESGTDRTRRSVAGILRA